MKSAYSKHYIVLVFLLLSNVIVLWGQHTNTMNATLDGETKEIKIKQRFIYVNTSADTLRTLYFNDWNHAYSSKNTGLAERFAEDFKKSLHLAKDSERAFTRIISAVSDNYEGLEWKRTKEEDLVKLELNGHLAPNDSIGLFFTYVVKLPPKKYTPYGYNSRNRYYLKDWYLTPCVYDGEWQLYSNKDLEDLYTGQTNTSINFTYPAEVYLTSNFSTSSIARFPGGQNTNLSGTNRRSCEIILWPTNEFTKHITSNTNIITDLETANYDEISQGISIEKTMRYIQENLGQYPHEHLLVSTLDYNKDPLYGLNLLPSFVRPYERQFQFEMKFLKTALRQYLSDTILIDPRKNRWLIDAIMNYLMISYVEQYYPDQKLLGKLSKIWGVRSYNLAKKDFNDQYALLYMLSARRNSDQPLTTPNDSLLWFNQKVANRYKAGLGLAYLAEYVGKEKIDSSIKRYYNEYKLKDTSPDDFQAILEDATDKNINWFFNEYVSTDKRIDFRIQKVQKTDDSIRVTIKNKRGTNVPISLFGVQKDSVVSKYWFSNIVEKETFVIPRNGEDRLVLNYDQKIPEFNPRDNWKTLNGFFSGNKKLKFQFFKDTEDPTRNQIFYTPVASFNIYDGLTPGLRVTNKTFLQRPFIFDFAPSYGLLEEAFVGYGRFSYQKYHRKTGFYFSRYSLGGSTFHFQTNSRYSTITPSISFGWRPKNMLSNKREFLTFRYVNVFRDIDENLDLETDPDYRVLNARYTNTNNGIINYFSWFADAQHSSDFTKVSFNMEYRQLFDNNRQLNLRLFAGKFLRNTTESDFFSFALDRPTDYLFDYSYLGRSEDTGIYSQQIIIAEGGFKSRLRDPFANDWIATVNASFNLWRWIELYGDTGFIRNSGDNARFVYDSGIRLNLVTDYFELYFPLYSNNGWEPSQPDYEEKIRFIVTLSPKTLIRLFTRKWF